jgi:hypothetical protein
MFRCCEFNVVTRETKLLIVLDICSRNYVFKKFELVIDEGVSDSKGNNLLNIRNNSKGKMGS